MSALVVACLEDAEAARALHHALRAEGYEAEIHSAMPLAGVHPPPGTRPRTIAYAAAVAAVVAAVLAVAVQYYTGELAYPLDIGGRSVNWLAYSFVAISLAMMWAAIASVVAFLRLSGLPDLRARLFASGALQDIAANRYVIALEADPARAAAIRDRLTAHEGGRRVEVVDDDA